MGRYRLTKAADEDVESIFEYGIDTFGLDQGLDYLTGIKQRFIQLADTPFLYPAIEHVRSGFRRSVYRSHSIYYRVDPDEVVIVRI